jgi:hypothetical protein
MSNYQKITDQILAQMQPIHYAANKKHGVFQIDPIDYPERELMSVKGFLESLSSLDDERNSIHSGNSGRLGLLPDRTGLR